LCKQAQLLQQFDQNSNEKILLFNKKKKEKKYKDEFLFFKSLGDFCGISL